MRSVDADELKKVFNGYHSGIGSQPKFTLGACLQLIDNAPTVQPEYFPPCEDCNKKMEEIRQAYDKMKAMERPHDKWITNTYRPLTADMWIRVTYRPLTTEERIAFAEHYGIEYCDTLDEKAFDCHMPEDRQDILISTSWGVVEDVADNDIDGEGFICYGLEINGDWDGVDAWMPKPEPYKKEGKEE